MKVVLLSVLLFALHLTSNAQFKVIGEGPLLNDPKAGNDRLVLLKNGNTLYFSLRGKEGIRVRIYNEAHKQIFDRRASPDLGKPSSFSIRGIFEVNGDVVVLISDVDEHQIVLHRLVIDGQKGVLKQTDKIEELTRFSYAKGFGLAFGGVPIPDFFVEKMPDGNGYVVALMNSFESDRNKRISVVVYGGDHKVLNRAYYNSPDNRFKYMQYIGMAVPDADHICVMAYAYNTRASGGKEKEIVMATMNRTDTAMALSELKTIEKDRKGEVLRYSPVSKKLYFLYVSETRGSYEGDITIIDPYTAKVTFTSDVLVDGKTKLKDSPQNMLVNRDGSFALIYEDVNNITGPTQKGYPTHVYAHLDDITILQFDSNGKNIGNAIIPKRFYLSDYSRNILYHANIKAWGAELFNYLSTPGGNFIVLNNELENVEKANAGRKLSKIKSLDDCEGFYYPLKGGNAEGKAMFEGSRKDNYQRGKFWIYDYDATRNIYVTIKFVSRGDDGLASRLVWMQP